MVDLRQHLGDRGITWLRRIALVVVALLALPVLGLVGMYLILLVGELRGML